ncbi:unnamed protein product [Brachionus calyciflorus]|uniref:G-protein coupled receptors family 1 profile domain-containing protein n=1 Tax=Brachionus calyciflorus TaxID=104777 RepID=A0A814IM16_9BILA|nr:unnamed protein product [Brachionus calyciflorus]
MSHILDNKMNNTLYTIFQENMTQIDEICTSFINDTDIRNMCKTYYHPNLKIKKDLDSLIFSLIKTFYPFLLIFGLFGNSITFLTMLRIYTRRKNYQKFCFSLAILALADLLVLIIGCLREYLEIIFTINIRSNSDLTCKLNMFSCYLFSFFSVYLHGFIAIERWLAVSDPLKSKSKFTFRISKIIILIIFLVCIVLTLPYLYFPKLEKSIQINHNSFLNFTIIDECAANDEMALLSIDSLFYCLIPFLVTILFSSLTVFKLIQSKTMMNRSNETEILRQNSLRCRAMFRKRDSAKRSIVNYDIKRKSLHSTVSSNFDVKYSPFRINLTKSYSPKTTNHSSNLKITIMLMALPICYLITTFPIFVIIIYSWFISHFSLVKDDVYDLDRAYAITKIFMYVHNSINILIYIFFGKSFRKDFIGILPFKSLYNKLTRTSRNSSNCEISLTNSFKIHLNNYNMNEIQFLNENMLNLRRRTYGHVYDF